MSRHIVALIQARMGSSRLPAKSLLYLHDRPLIDWVTHRVAQSKLLDDIIVVIPRSLDNDPLEAHLTQQNISIFRGPEEDVLKRMRLAGEKSKATHVVRICADNPLVWGKEIDNLIRFYFDTPCDYAYNHIPLNNQYPDGIGAEIVSMQLLQEIAKKAIKREHKEHCLSYIWSKNEKYTIRTFDPHNKKLWRPDIKLDIDSLRDYRKIALLPITVSSAPEEIIAFFPAKDSSALPHDLICPGRR